MPLEPKVWNGFVWSGKKFQTFKILDAFFLGGVHHASWKSLYLPGHFLRFFSSKLMLFASYSNMTKPHSVSLSGGVSDVQCNCSAPLSQGFWAPTCSCESLILSSAKNNLKCSLVAKGFSTCLHSHGSSFGVQGKQVLPQVLWGAHSRPNCGGLQAGASRWGWQLSLKFSLHISKALCQHLSAC